LEFIYKFGYTKKRVLHFSWDSTKDYGVVLHKDLINNVNILEEIPLSPNETYSVKVIERAQKLAEENGLDTADIESYKYIMLFKNLQQMDKTYKIEIAANEVESYYRISVDGVELLKQSMSKTVDDFDPIKIQVVFIKLIMRLFDLPDEKSVIEIIH